MTDRLSQGDRIKCTFEGLEDRALLKELGEFLRHQATINRLVSRIITSPHQPGIAIELRMRRPEIVELTWRDYQIRATGFEGELFIVCKKQEVAHGQD